MDKQRTRLGNMLFKMAKKIYPAGKDGNEFMKEWGDLLFKAAAKVSPDKPAPTTKKLVGKKKTK